MNQLMALSVLVAVLSCPKVLAASFGYKMVSGAQRENLYGILMRDNEADQDLIWKTRKTIMESPDFVGYQIGLSLFYQPVPEVPFSAGVSIMRRDMGSNQEEAKLSGFQCGIELNLWLPHESVEPYLLLGGGGCGQTSMRGDYEENGDIAYGYSFTGQSRFLKGGMGLKLRSTKQLSAYVQIESGMGLSVGNISYSEGSGSEDAAFTGENLTSGVLTNVMVESRVQSVSIGIDWM